MCTMQHTQRRTVQRGGQRSTEALKERQSPPKKGALGLPKLHLGPQRRAIGTSIQIGELGTSILLWASLREQAKTSSSL